MNMCIVGAQDAMKLDREQRLSLVGLRNELFARMASIIDQRRCIISHLEVRLVLIESYSATGCVIHGIAWGSTACRVVGQLNGTELVHHHILLTRIFSLQASMSTPLSVCTGPNHHETFSKVVFTLPRMNIVLLRHAGVHILVCSDLNSIWY